MSCDNFAAGVFIKDDDVEGLVSDCVVGDVNVTCLRKMFFIFPKVVMLSSCRSSLVKSGKLSSAMQLSINLLAETLAMSAGM